MAKYIPLDALVAMINKRKEAINPTNSHTMYVPNMDKFYRGWMNALSWVEKEIINSPEVKEVDDSISKFKSLLHLHADIKSTCADGGYAPNLYFFDDSWHVDWISCTEGDSLIDFTDDTPEGAIQKAYEWFHSTFKNA